MSLHELSGSRGLGCSIFPVFSLILQGTAKGSPSSESQPWPSSHALPLSFRALFPFSWLSLYYVQLPVARLNLKKLFTSSIPAYGLVLNVRSEMSGFNQWGLSPLVASILFFSYLPRTSALLCLRVCLCDIFVPGAQGSQKRVCLELKTFVSRLVGAEIPSNFVLRKSISREPPLQPLFILSLIFTSLA